MRSAGAHSHRVISPRSKSMTSVTVPVPPAAENVMAPLPPAASRFEPPAPDALRRARCGWLAPSASSTTP